MGYVKLILSYDSHRRPSTHFYFTVYCCLQSTKRWVEKQQLFYFVLGLESTVSPVYHEGVVNGGDIGYSFRKQIGPSASPPPLHASPGLKVLKNYCANSLALARVELRFLLFLLFFKY
jgi:hypothetical protein